MLETSLKKKMRLTNEIVKKVARQKMTSRHDVAVTDKLCSNDEDYRC